MSKRVLNLLSAAALLLCVETARAFYNPTTGRWLSRDPIGEKGGNNLERGRFLGLLAVGWALSESWRASYGWNMPARFIM